MSILDKIKNILLVYIIVIWSCEEPDSLSPVINVSPIDGSEIGKTFYVIADITDESEIDRVDFIINGSIVFSDSEFPYKYQINTIPYSDGYRFIIQVSAYDEAGNTSTEQVIYTVNNNLYRPSKPGLTISLNESISGDLWFYWTKSEDEDFKMYQILHSISDNEIKDTILTKYDIDDNQYSVGVNNEILHWDPNYQNQYWVRVVDSVGLSAISDGKYNPINTVTPSDIAFTDLTSSSAIIRWSKCKDDDFKKYILYESLFESMAFKTEIYTSQFYDINDTTYTIQNIDWDNPKYYQVVTEDPWGLDTNSNVVAPLPEFENFSSELGLENIREVHPTSDGGYIIIGLLSDNQSSLVKIDFLGFEEWNVSFNQEDIRSIHPTADNGYIFTGSKNGDVYLLKTDNLGNEEWSKTFGNSSGFDLGRSVRQTNDNGYIIAGYTETMGDTIENEDGELAMEQCLVLKADNLGNEEWSSVSYVYGWSVNTGSAVYAESATDDGFIATYRGAYEYIVSKLSNDGIENWRKSVTIWDYLEADRSDAISTLDGGSIFLEGGFNGYGPRIKLIKLNSTGDIEFEKLMNEDIQESFDMYADIPISVQGTSDGGYIISGTQNKSNDTYSILIKTDSQGNEEWEKSFLLTDIKSAKQTLDGGYLLNSDSWIKKISNNGNSI